mmetsp:Transcript_313/g.765  ORF Transcript_313/g.765 Transcript_313/m.765 type:complete len:223 (+) Transcript_313:1632-2300(+)
MESSSGPSSQHVCRSHSLCLEEPLIIAGLSNVRTRFFHHRLKATTKFLARHNYSSRREPLSPMLSPMLSPAPDKRQRDSMVFLSLSPTEGHNFNLVFTVSKRIRCNKRVFWLEGGCQKLSGPIRCLQNGGGVESSPTIFFGVGNVGVSFHVVDPGSCHLCKKGSRSASPRAAGPGVYKSRSGHPRKLDLTRENRPNHFLPWIKESCHYEKPHPASNLKFSTT